MTIAQRFRPAVAASLKHLLASCVVALVCATLVFGLWYPYPYSELVGGRELFLLVVSADVVSGPLLTLVVFNPRKPRTELMRDIGIVVVLQLAALAYGLHSVAEARPVFLAFEGDRFRAVMVPDIDVADILDAPQHLRDLSLRGPRLIGVRLAKPTDPDYPSSIQAALNGNPPAFRPGRWVDFEGQRADVIAAVKPLTALRTKHPHSQQRIDEAVKAAGVTEQRVGFLPFVAGSHSDWIVLVGLDDAKPKGFLPLDGFD